MSKFRCTVEYRLDNGAIQHQTGLLEADTADAAAELARRQWLGGHDPGPNGESGEIEEIVCELVPEEGVH